MTKTERENWKQEMFSLIKKWQKSGITQKDFCDRHDITLHAFYYWLRKYKQVYKSSENGFVPVEIGPMENNFKREEIQIHYPNGVLITVDKAVSISRIKALIKAI
jgi:transposase-like protein